MARGTVSSSGQEHIAGQELGTPGGELHPHGEVQAPAQKYKSPHRVCVERIAPTCDVGEGVQARGLLGSALSHSSAASDMYY